MTNVSPSPQLTNEFYLTATNVTVSINGSNVRALVYKDTPPGGGGPGTLTFDARPWCNVQIDGANVGQTPVVNRSLSAGRHRVTCTNPELGVTRTVQVDIVSGQPTRQRLQLQ